MASVRECFVAFGLVGKRKDRPFKQYNENTAPDCVEPALVLNSILKAACIKCTIGLSPGIAPCCIIFYATGKRQDVRRTRSQSEMSWRQGAQSIQAMVRVCKQSLRKGALTDDCWCFPANYEFKDQDYACTQEVPYTTTAKIKMTTPSLI